MIDPSKTYRTRDGREVRIYATDGGGSRPVHGAIKDGDIWVEYSWFGLHKPHESDLIEVRPRIKREFWVNVFDDIFFVHTSKEEADLLGGEGRIACVCVMIDCEEGEGL